MEVHKKSVRTKGTEGTEGKPKEQTISPLSRRFFLSTNHHQNRPLWQRIHNYDTTSSRRWQGSCTGVSLARATTKPESWFVQSPGVKNTPQSTKKARHHDQSSVVISGSAQTQHVRAKAADQGHPPLPQDTPNTPSTSDRVGGVHWCPWRPTRHHQKI